MLALINATLIDGTGAAPRKGMKVLIDNKKIKAIGRYIIIPEDAEIIDLKCRVLLPGLIDAHSHLGDHPYKDRAGIDSAEGSDNYSQMRSLNLEAGVTTIRSCGDYMYDTAAVRDAINSDKIIGPRLVCSGKTFMRSDSHPAITVWASDQATVDNCGAYPDNPDKAREMVREAVEAKMDFIKMIVSDTHILFWPKKSEPLAPAIIKAVIEEAHKFNMTVACHVDHLEQAKLVLEYGADEIHHLANISAPSFELPEYAELFTKMCKQNVWLVPTLAAPRAFEAVRIARKCPDGGIDYCLKLLRMAYEYGVPFGLGCDSGCPGVPWGKCVWEEMGEYVYNIGMTPLEAIRCATVNNARMLGMENKIGVIHAGASADLLVLDKNPAEDIGNIDSILLVFREGSLVAGNHAL